MTQQDTQQRLKDTQIQIESALLGIKLAREALLTGQNVDPGLIAYNIARYQEIILKQLEWLNTNGFVAVVAHERLSLQEKKRSLKKPVTAESIMERWNEEWDGWEARIRALLLADGTLYGYTAYDVESAVLLQMYIGTFTWTVVFDTEHLYHFFI